MQEFYKSLSTDKIKINCNKMPIKMDLFLSFLTVKVNRQKNFLGSDLGWTKLTGENCLEISGGIANGAEYLDNLKYKKNLNNPYNNYVNPFYLFEILTDSGKKFFVEYYADEIGSVLTLAKNSVSHAVNTLSAATAHKEKLFKFWESHGVPITDT